jgi:Ca2+-transporting ATPase
VCSLAFEGAPEHPQVMRRPPRRSHEGLVGWPMLWRGLLQGAVVLAACIAIDAWALANGRGEDEARTLAIVALTVGNLGLVWLNASLGVGWAAVFGRGFGAFWGVAAIACGALAAAIHFPGVRALLRFAVPQPDALAWSVLAPVAAVMLLALVLRTPATRRTDAPASRPR